MDAANDRMMYSTPVATETTHIRILLLRIIELDDRFFISHLFYLLLYPYLIVSELLHCSFSFELDDSDTREDLFMGLDVV